MEQPSPATFDAAADRLAARVERLLDERTTKYAGSLHLLTAGLQEELASTTEAINQLSAQLAAVSTQLAEVSRLLRQTVTRIDVLDSVVLGSRPAIVAETRLQPAGDGR